METITKSFSVYTYEELVKLGNTGAIKKANQNIMEDMEETVHDFYLHEFEDSLKEFAKVLGTSIQNYSFGLFSRSYITFNLEEHKDNDNVFKNEAVKELNNYKKWNDAEYTGVYTDVYISEYLTKHYPNGLTYNDLTTIVKNAPQAMLEAFQNDNEKHVLDEREYKEYAEVREWDFKEDGSLYFE